MDFLAFFPPGLLIQLFFHVPTHISKQCLIFFFPNFKRIQELHTQNASHLNISQTHLKSKLLCHNINSGFVFVLQRNGCCFAEPKAEN